ncbi:MULTISPECIES: YetF domain-containing protein [unclassified Arcicella]|uniref:DUF421 domain-containing protein n=1 Tax=unclassified Arcicella TaxID=2644986 RepID=UPI0028670B4A|nr:MULTISPECIES: YetF domain-containing protein [unclassified Arcicella]MDR6563090.1 uncharacterized membrane protein YcaP (DUF421 family) [Arcicella sp. BE51]MDR6811759.1 uncharacterized membrane protein YcaP (DUF421 family) [Arcicella sp. BE140]MDR6823284.1 uncharacterized membrane protein YcaP (DUF421 family) [Arcicella sp. BE139]
MNFLIISLKSIAVYVFIVAAIRLFGKKELSQLSVIDLVFILLISNAVQNAMVGDDTSLLGGFAAAGSLFVMNFVLKKVMFKHESISKLIQGEPLMLVYQGEIKEKALEKSGLTLDELHAAIREHGVEKVEKVDLAILEVDGNISVLSNDYKHRTSKKRKAHKMLSKNG